MASLAGGAYLVTGGTQGLGAETARRLARAGAGGITICGRDEPRGAAVARDLEELGARAQFVRTELADADACRAAVLAHDDAFGRIDGLANVGASTARGTIEDTTTEAWDRMMAINLRAPFVLMQEAIRLIKRDGRGGSIVNVLSISAHGGQPFITAYCASKGGLAVLTKNVAHAVRGDRIRVNGINMGWTATDNEHIVQRQEGAPENWLELADASMPFGRLLRPADVAKLIVYLLSDDAELMTGSIIDFDQRVVGAWD